MFAALGLPKRTLMGVLRISFSPESTVAEGAALAQALGEIRSSRMGI